MKKILLLVALLFSLSVAAQDMKSIYINMPDSLSPILTKVDREDFADFLESNMRAQVKNKLEENSEMKVLTEDYMLLQTTSRSTLQMKLLPIGESEKVICAVVTVDGPVSDSSISFYTTNWQELPADQYLNFPVREDFFLENDTIDIVKQNLARSKADINLIKADLSASDLILSFVYTTPQYLDEDSAKELIPLIKSDPLIYEWVDNEKFIQR